MSTPHRISGSAPVVPPTASAQAASPRRIRTLPPECSAKCRGVTLLELILVLVLVATMAAVAVSRRSSLDLDPFADAEALKGALRTTRTRAMADIVPWSFQVAGQTGTYRRNGVAAGTVDFITANVAAGTITFDTRGAPAGTLSFAVTGYSGSPVTVIAQTGFIP